MVRKDPMNNRGPVPKGGRPAPVNRTDHGIKSLFTLKPYAEYEKLWEAAITDTQSSIQRLRELVNIDLPGADSDDLQILLLDLQRIIEANKDGN